MSGKSQTQLQKGQFYYVGVYAVMLLLYRTFAVLYM